METRGLAPLVQPCDDECSQRAADAGAKPRQQLPIFNRTVMQFALVLGGIAGIGMVAAAIISRPSALMRMQHVGMVQSLAAEAQHCEAIWQSGMFDTKWTSRTSAAHAEHDRQVLEFKEDYSFDQYKEDRKRAQEKASSTESSMATGGSVSGGYGLFEASVSAHYEESDAKRQRELTQDEFNQMKKNILHKKQQLESRESTLDAASAVAKSREKTMSPEVSKMYEACKKFAASQLIVNVGADKMGEWVDISITFELRGQATKHHPSITALRIDPDEAEGSCDFWGVPSSPDPRMKPVELEPGVTYSVICRRSKLSTTHISAAVVTNVAGGIIRVPFHDKVDVTSIVELRQGVDNLLRQIGKLEDDDKAAEDSIQQLEDENAAASARIHQLEDKIAAAKDRIQQVEDDNRAGSHRIQQLEDEQPPAYDNSAGAKHTKEGILGPCMGDCDHDRHCQPGLYCWQRDTGDPGPPDCRGSPTLNWDYCSSVGAVQKLFYREGPDKKLGPCEGGCKKDNDCKPGLYCWQRESKDDPGPPGCAGSLHENWGYCSSVGAVQTLFYDDVGLNPDEKLGPCEGDCDDDNDCKDGFRCWDRSDAEAPGPPGCAGSPYKNWDYCYAEHGGA